MSYRLLCTLIELTTTNFCKCIMYVRKKVCDENSTNSCTIVIIQDRHQDTFTSNKIRLLNTLIPAFFTNNYNKNWWTNNHLLTLLWVNDLFFNDKFCIGNKQKVSINNLQYITTKWIARKKINVESNTFCTATSKHKTSKWTQV